MSQLTEADVKRLYAARKYDEIEQARVEGRLDVVLGADPADVAVVDRARDGQITTADVHTLTRLGRHDLITAAATAGRITDLNRPNEGA